MKAGLKDQDEIDVVQPVGGGGPSKWVILREIKKGFAFWIGSNELQYYFSIYVIVIFI